MALLFPKGNVYITLSTKHVSTIPEIERKVRTTRREIIAWRGG